MQDYLSKGKELIKILISNGFEGFFVGEAVRNTILDLDYSRVDIVTNAKLMDIKRCFSVVNTESICLIDNDVLEVRYKNYPFYFKTYQLTNIDKDVVNNTIKHYSSGLIDDLSTKNYTINAIAMSYSGKITDAYGGCEDLKKKVIKTLVKSKHRFVSNPIDILEGIAIQSELNFKIHAKTLKGMKNKSKQLVNANSDLVIGLIEKIINGKYSKKAINSLINTKSYKYLPSLTKGLNKLYLRHKSVNINQFLLMSYTLNGSVDDRYDIAIKDKNKFNLIYDCIINYPNSKYDDFVLYKYGLDVCLEANYVNYCLGKASKKDKKIKKNYNKLIIKNINEINYPVSELIRISEVNDKNIIEDIYDNLAIEILSYELDNSFDAIQSRVVKLLSERGIYSDLSRRVVINSLNSNIDDSIFKDELDTEELSKLDEQGIEIVSTSDFETRKLRELEERINEQDRLLEEKNRKLKELEEEKKRNITNKFINTSIDSIVDLDKDNVIIKNKEEFKNQYTIFVNEYIRKQDNYDNEEN